MTVLAEPTTGDIPRINPDGDRTQVLRMPADLTPPADPGESTTRLTPPPRRPATDDTLTQLPLVESLAGMPTGAELTVASRLAGPQKPPPPLPKPKGQPAVPLTWFGRLTYRGAHRAGAR